MKCIYCGNTIYFWQNASTEHKWHDKCRTIEVEKEYRKEYEAKRLAKEKAEREAEEERKRLEAEAERKREYERKQQIVHEEAININAFLMANSPMFRKQVENANRYKQETGTITYAEWLKQNIESMLRTEEEN